MSINKNLQNLRLSKGMTQEEVGEKIGLTRQAVSSYESGRTRPGIDMLMRFAELYGTDLDGILYGESREQRAVRGVKRTAAVVLAVVLLLILARAALMWYMNAFFAIPSGMAMTDKGRRLVEVRFSLLRAWELLQGLASVAAFVGFLVLLVLLCRLERPLPVRYKLSYTAALIVGSAVCTLPFAFADRVYGVYSAVLGSPRFPADYLLLPGTVSAFALVFLLLSVVLDRVRNRRAR